jgi:hypothetical protein
MATFKLFPQLPPEIRLHIWEEAATIPEDEHIVADFGAELFEVPEMQELRRLKCRFYLRLGGDCKALGTLGANVESRQATLRMNPDFLQFNSGPKLYFNTGRNAIHFDLNSLYFIGLYFDQNLPKMKRRGIRSPIDGLVNSSSRKKHLVQNLRGFCGIKTLSLPTPLHNLSLLTVSLLFGERNAANAFAKVERILPKSLPNTMQDTDIWEEFMTDRIDDLLCRDVLTLDFNEKIYLEHARKTYSKIMCHYPITMWPWPAWAAAEIERIRHLLEQPPY